MPTMSNWVKTTPYGDYRDSDQNHKNVDKEHQNLIQTAKKWNIKHAGSKKFNTLKNTVLNMVTNRNTISKLNKRIERLIINK
jgi:hypothetical protein